MQVNNSVQAFYRNLVNDKSNKKHSSDIGAISNSSAQSRNTALSAKGDVLEFSALYAQAATETAGTQASMITDDAHIKNVEFTWEHWLGVDISQPLNADSTGNQSLTDEQIQMLKEKYDVNDLTQQEEYDLLRELTDLGVITKMDAINTRFVAAPKVGILTRAGELRDIDKDVFSNILERLDVMAYNERFYYKKMIKEYGIEQENLIESANSHQRVADILRQLVR